MNETLLRNWVRKMLLEQAAYEPACQYEVDVNYRLAAAGARSSYTPPPEPNFCVGTDTGGDAEFNAVGPDGRKTPYNLELKAGSGNKRDSSPGFSHPAGQGLLEGIARFNNVTHVSSIVAEDLSRRTGNGILVVGDYDEVPPESIRKVAQFIVDAQQSSIDSHLNTDVPSKVKGLTLYYYFGRTKNAQNELDIPKPFDLSKPDESLVGTFEQRYSKANTHYIQIENAGLFYMVNDPLGLETIGAKSFSGNMKTSARYRVESSGGKMYNKWSPIEVAAIKNGEATTVTCKVRTKDYYINVIEDINVSSKTQSDLNLDRPADLAKFAEFIQTPPPVEKSMSESMLRKLISRVLLEGRGEDFERFLSVSLAQTGGPITANVQKGSSYDIDLMKAGKPARVEVKLSDADQLGKINKRALSSFKFNFQKDRFEYERDKVAMSKGTPASQRYADDKYDFIKTLMDAAISALNDPAVVKFFKTTIPGCSEDTESIDLRGRTRERELGRLGMDTSYPEETQKQLCPMQVPVANDDESLEVTEEYRKVTAKIPGSVMSTMMKSKCDYLLIGNNDPKSFSGRIGTVGNGDPLGLGVAPIEFGDIGIEIRWGNKGSVAAPSHSFIMETRAESISGGTAFSSPLDFPGNKMPRRRKNQRNK